MALSKAVKEEATKSIKVQKMQGDDQWLSKKNYSEEAVHEGRLKACSVGGHRFLKT